MIITQEYLDVNSTHIFVFGDNLLHKGYGGAAKLRNNKNAYGFITKKHPSHNDDAYFKPNGEYRRIFLMELWRLEKEIKKYPDKTYLISKIGSGLANKYKIWEKVIQPGLEVLRKYPNVVFLCGVDKL